LLQSILESQGEKIAPGPISTIAWPLRAVRLLPESDGESLTVRSMVYAAGLPLDNTEERGKQDDMVAQRVTADKRVLPLRFSENKAIWRNVEAFLPLVKHKESEQATRIPPVVKHALAVWATIRERDVEHVRGLRVIGQINDKSKVDLVVDSSFVLGPAALDAERHGQGILDVVKTAEDLGSALSVAGYILAKNLLKYRCR
jgi:CRISPR-associated protein Cse1 (CRISPR_cse1)